MLFKGHFFSAHFNLWHTPQTGLEPVDALVLLRPNSLLMNRALVKNLVF